MTRQAVFDHKAFLRNCTQGPGVYQMYAGDGGILYVGKARNLKKRLASYFRATGLTPKTQALVARIAHIELTVTYTETEALILEQNLIKANRPPYNILLRDDKSYPYIHVSAHEYPRIGLHRGPKNRGGRYFGPYPSVLAVRESLKLLQRVFLLRPCEDSVFQNRSRPCLQYQIKRCSAPCVGYIGAEEYAADVRRASMLLEGKNQDLLRELADAMEQAAAALEFERAAVLRDQVNDLRQVQEKQYMEGEVGDLDIIGVARQSGAVCVHVLFVRGGRVLGSKSFHPRVPLDQEQEEVLSEFLAQFYVGSGERDLPRDIIVPVDLPDADALGDAIRTVRGRAVGITSRVRGPRARWQSLAQTAAHQNLQSHLVKADNLSQRFEALRDALSLEETPQRMECFDISHSGGEATVASCVVFDGNGPRKSDYRRFNIEGIQAGDDYAAMEQALTRRYTRLQSGEGILPDILFIDGGKGQLARAEQVMDALQVQGVLLVGIAKGESRKPGLETLILGGSHRELHLPRDSVALHLIQHVRDEAHRFAITGHKQRRGKARTTSPLEGIPGVGPRRRRELLKHFGGIQGVIRASVEELSKVPQISEKLAEDIYTALHDA